LIHLERSCKKKAKKVKFTSTPDGDHESFSCLEFLHDVDRKEGGLRCYSKPKNAKKYHPRPSMKSLSAYGIHLWQKKRATRETLSFKNLFFALQVLKEIVLSTCSEQNAGASVNGKISFSMLTLSNVRTDIDNTYI